jgi:hypothetical protein
MEVIRESSFPVYSPYFNPPVAKNDIENWAGVLEKPCSGAF